MVLPKKKKDKIRNYLKAGKTWDYIKNKEGVSNDAINKVRQEPSSSSTSATSQADKILRVIQDPASQKRRTPATKNTPDSHVRDLEQKINDVNHVQQTDGLQIQHLIKRLNELEKSHQTQEPPKQPHQEKPDNERELDELKNQEIKAKSLPTTTPTVQLPKKNQDHADAPTQDTKINTPSSSLGPDVEQMSEVDPDQTNEPPQGRKREYIEIQPYHIKFILDMFRLPGAIQKAQETGVFTWPSSTKVKQTKKMSNNISMIIPVLSSISASNPPPFPKKEPNGEPHNNSDSECLKESSHDEPNKNKDQPSNIKKTSTITEKDDI
jgi:hypothetical protein